MTGRNEFVRQHPHLALELDRIGHRAVLGAAWRDMQATSQVDLGLVIGGIPFAAGFAVLVAGMCAWSWTLWLILPVILLGWVVFAWAVDLLAWLVQFAGRWALRSAWLRGAGPDRRGGDQR